MPVVLLSDHRDDGAVAHSRGVSNDNDALRATSSESAGSKVAGSAAAAIQTAYAAKYNRCCASPATTTTTTARASYRTIAGLNITNACATGSARTT
jgi:hypothetical protein